MNNSITKRLTDGNNNTVNITVNHYRSGENSMMSHLGGTFGAMMQIKLLERLLDPQLPSPEQNAIEDQREERDLNIEKEPKRIARQTAENLSAHTTDVEDVEYTIVPDVTYDINEMLTSRKYKYPKVVIALHIEEDDFGTLVAVARQVQRTLQEVMNVRKPSFILKIETPSGTKYDWFITHNTFLTRLAKKHGISSFTLYEREGAMKDYLRGIENSTDIIELHEKESDIHFKRIKIKQGPKTEANIFEMQKH